MLLGLIASSSYAQGWPGGWTNKINFNILKVDTLEERTSGQGIYVTHNIEFAGAVIGGTVSSGILTILEEDATTDAITDLLILNHTGGTVAAGFGTGVAFKLEDAGGSEEQASIDVLLQTVTDDAEDVDVIFYVNSGGDITEALRLVGSGGNVFVVAGGKTAGQALQALTVESFGPSTSAIGVSQDSSNNLLALIGATSANAGQLDLRTHQNVTSVQLKADGNSYFNAGNVAIGKATATAVLAVAGDIVSNTYNFAADSQGNDDYEVALPDIAALTTGLMVTFTANTANTDGATLEITSVGDLDAILKLNDQTLATNDIEAGQVVVVVFDGSSWQMVSPAAN